MIIHDRQIKSIGILQVIMELFSFVELLVVSFRGASTFKAKLSFIIIKFIMKDLINYL